MDYLIVKWLHIVSAMLLFGTGLGTAFFKFTADLSGNLSAIAETNRRVVLADWLFTTPTILIQPLTGYLLARMAGWSLAETWLAWSLALYVIAGLCWLPVVRLQIRMRNDSVAALAASRALPTRYREDCRRWLLLGLPAFFAMLGVLYLMTAKTTL